MLRGGVIGLALAVVLPFGPRADAATATIQPNPTGYYTKTQDPFRTASGPAGEAVCSVPSPDPRTCLNPAQITGGTPGYPRKDNYVYVARINGDDDSHGVIGVPLFSVPLRSTITSLMLDFYVENEAAVGTIVFDPDAPGMQFCMNTEGFAGQDAAPYDSRPDTDCEAQAAPKKVKEEERTEETEEGAPITVSLVQYSVDLMPMARKWASGAENNGVTVLPTTDAPSTFQTAIRTPAIAPDGMRVRVIYTPGDPIAGPSAPPPEPAPAAERAPSFAEPEPDEPEPSFNVPEEEPAEEPLAAPRPVSATTPWWTFLGLPIGLAALAGMGRGLTEPIQTAAAERAGPVSRLMSRGGRS